MKRYGKKKKITKPYSKGELNKLIDILCHPLFETNEGFILVYGFLHGLSGAKPTVIDQEIHEIQSAWAYL